MYMYIFYLYNYIYMFGLSFNRSCKYHWRRNDTFALRFLLRQRTEGAQFKFLPSLFDDDTQPSKGGKLLLTSREFLVAFGTTPSTSVIIHGFLYETLVPKRDDNFCHYGYIRIFDDHIIL